MSVFEPNRDDVMALIGMAMAAPSADNQHRVRFAILEDRIQLSAVDEVTTVPFGHRQKLALLSFGAIAENLRISLASRGRKFEPRWFPLPKERRLLIEVVWSTLPAVSADEPLAAQIAARHTNRRFFRGPPLSATERSTIDDCVHGEPGLELDWFAEPGRRGALLRMMRLAEAARFRDRDHHAELFASIAFDAGWSASVTEHLAPGSLEVEPPFRRAFALLRSWPVMRAANRIGAAAMLGARVGDLPARLAPHVLAITASSPGREAFLNGGRVLQRVWLTAQSLGLALQPLAASAVLVDDPAVAGPGGIDLPGRWRDVIGTDRTPVIVFRLGHARPARVRSLRRPADDYVDWLDRPR